METLLDRHVLTLRNRKEHDEQDCITMGTSHRVVHVSQGHIERVKIVLTGSNRDSHLDILSLPRITGTNVAPCVDSSLAISSYEQC